MEGLRASFKRRKLGGGGWGAGQRVKGGRDGVERAQITYVRGQLDDQRGGRSVGRPNAWRA